MKLSQILGMDSSPRRWSGTGTGSQGTDHDTKPGRVQVAFGQFSKRCGLNFEWFCMDPDLVSLFQLGIFY